MICLQVAVILRRILAETYEALFLQEFRFLSYWLHTRIFLIEFGTVYPMETAWLNLETGFIRMYGFVTKIPVVLQPALVNRSWKFVISIKLKLV